MTARLIPAMEPGSLEWFQYMTASKIAACMGLSTYESKFSLWHRMAGLLAPEADNDVKRRGHYLEPAIRAWFADQHPEWAVLTTGTWVNDDRPWQAASPDARVHDLALGFPVADDVIAVAEFKSAHEDEDWGQPGTDDIPVGHRCQVMWQMDTLGVDVCYVALLNRHLTFVEYVVHYDEAEAKLLRKVAEEFMDSLARNERPDIDAHSQTYAAVRALHPQIDEADVELDAELARAYCQARAGLAHAAAEEQRTKALVADRLGNAKRARFMKSTIAQRQAKNGGVPYLVAGRSLPTFGDTE